MHRRQFLQTLAGAMTVGALPALAFGSTSLLPMGGRAQFRLGAAWRGPASDSQQMVGMLDVDWDKQSIRIHAAQPIPSRAHGLFAEADGSLLAMAYRPGTWLLRMGPDGKIMQQIDIRHEPGERRFSGHVILNPQAGNLLTTEVDPRNSEGWVGVRDLHTLKKVDEWRTFGTDPHQLLTDAQGQIMLANGGVPRTPDGINKMNLERMDSSLVRLDAKTGKLLGQWRLPDSRLSLRHMAWNTQEDEAPVLGIALQGEHDQESLRNRAPVLALWDGKSLSLPSPQAQVSGYGADIAPALGGFVVTAQKAGKALWWRYDQPEKLQVIAELREACAISPVASTEGGVAMAGALGLGRWHPKLSPLLLPWPEPMALDNHWVELPLPA